MTIPKIAPMLMVIVEMDLWDLAYLSRASMIQTIE